MAKQTVTGVVNQVTAKPWEDRETGENITLYSFTLDGSRKFYRTGTNKPPVTQGDAIRFVLDGQKVDLDTIESVEVGAVQAPSPKESVSAQRTQYNSSPAANSGAGSRDGYWANKEARDLEKDTRYQNVDIPRMTMSTALTSAATVIEAAFKTEALSFGNTAKAKRVDMLGDFVEQLADRFYLKIANTPNNPPASKETQQESTSYDDGE